MLPCAINVDEIVGLDLGADDHIAKPFVAIPQLRG
jgi:DNA-binding response OmpR family regulator